MYADAHTNSKEQNDSKNNQAHTHTHTYIQGSPSAPRCLTQPLTDFVIRRVREDQSVTSTRTSIPESEEWVGKTSSSPRAFLSAPPVFACL
mmetsp:Transcript_26722/g.66499  ORF Transcript_26722/g.66499 Transcript_26722/m.66499 type:complete len:91 (-) Transcript_26722:1015-1287(-)